MNVSNQSSTQPSPSAWSTFRSVISSQGPSAFCGKLPCLGYAWLNKADFDPSGHIPLTFMGDKVQLKGRNLNAEARPNVRLFDGLPRHRVPMIQEADEHTMMRAEKSRR